MPVFCRDIPTHWSLKTFTVMFTCTFVLQGPHTVPISTPLLIIKDLYSDVHLCLCFAGTLLTHWSLKTFIVMFTCAFVLQGRHTVPTCTYLLIIKTFIVMFTCAFVLQGRRTVPTCTHPPPPILLPWSKLVPPSASSLANGSPSS